MSLINPMPYCGWAIVCWIWSSHDDVDHAMRCDAMHGACLSVSLLFTNCLLYVDACPSVND